MVWKSFIYFYFFIIYELTFTSYLKEGQCKTDIDDIVLGHMAIIPFPVLCKCRNVLQRAKTKGLKRANQIIKRIKVFDYFDFFD